MKQIYSVEQIIILYIVINKETWRVLVIETVTIVVITKFVIIMKVKFYQINH